MGSSVLGDAISSIRNWSVTEAKESRGLRATESFGSLVFNDEVQQTRLPKPVYHALRRTMTHGEPLDVSVADAVASAMKEWAVEHGATHYTHWFQPLTGITAEKHDSFLSPTGEGKAVLEFSGKELVRGEPDASSFPSGGMRSTFEARGYTAWDPTSPPWLLKSGNSTTLVVPTAFVSWTGEALDKKTPLLRSMEALSKQAVRILKLFGSTAERVVTTCGPEQEYFLIDQYFYLSRPDLINAGRTLFGAKPPKGQELEDQYFGAIPSRVMAFMSDVEAELFKVGVPVKTRHNEVAPSQYEIAPVFENANVATDHQMMVMETMRRTAPKYGLACLLHEKPFAGVNGSGKHLNWSMSDDEGNNLLGPGASTHDNMCSSSSSAAAVIRAVTTCYGRGCSAPASRARATIIGSARTKRPRRPFCRSSSATCSPTSSSRSRRAARRRPRAAANWTPASSCCPSCRAMPAIATGRARSHSPATSSSSAPCRSNQSIGYPNIALNVAVTWSRRSTTWRPSSRKAIEKGARNSKWRSASCWQKVIKAHKRIIFNGNGYSAEWEKEAKKRGLLNLKNTVDALPQLVAEAGSSRCSKKPHLHLQDSQRARTRRPPRDHGRDLQQDRERRGPADGPDGQPLLSLPAAFAYQKQVAESASAVKAAGGKSESARKVLAFLTKKVDEFKTRTNTLEKALAHESGGSEKHAKHFRDVVVPAMASALRETGDKKSSSRCRTRCGRSRPIAKCSSSSRGPACSARSIK